MIHPRFNTPAPRKWYSRFMPKIPSNVVAAVLVVGFLLGLFGTVLGGYIANIVKLVGMSEASGHMGEFVTRIIGIVVPPLGIFMGLFI